MSSIPEQLHQLRNIAEKPMRVHWTTAYPRHADDETNPQVVHAEKQHMRVCFPTSDGDPAVMEHIAAFDPPTALWLLDKLEDATKALTLIASFKGKTLSSATGEPYETGA